MISQVINLVCHCLTSLPHQMQASHFIIIPHCKGSYSQLLTHINDLVLDQYQAKYTFKDIVWALSIGNV